MNFNSFTNLIDGAAKKSKEILNHVNKKLDDTIFKNLNKCNKEFIEKKISTQDLPWKNNLELKQEILKISNCKTTFLYGPPRTTEFPINLCLYKTTINLLLQEDPRLIEMQNKLVPLYVDYFNFWRNYFYHISGLIEEMNIKRAPIELVASTNNTMINDEDDDLHIEDIDLAGVFDYFHFRVI
ncbi:hypothetical protein HZS_4418 [Henneguya salminicola]|nr:hypothetical protein HZS_4418 [Henneguya salminicola]